MYSTAYPYQRLTTRIVKKCGESIESNPPKARKITSNYTNKLMTKSYDAESIPYDYVYALVSFTH